MSYDLVERYTLDNKTFSPVYDEWNQDFGLAVNEVPIYFRRRDLNNSVLFLLNSPEFMVGAMLRFWVSIR